MPTMFPQTMGMPPEPEFIDPYTAQMAALRRKMEQQPPPLYTPEQVAQRRSQNAREHDLGLVGMLSGNEQLGNVGGQIFKRALAQRDPRVSERGTADPLSGEFKYSPEYLRAHDEQQLAGLEGKSANERARFDMAKSNRDERRYLAGQAAEDRRLLAREKSGGGELGTGTASQVGVDPNGQPVYRMKTGQLYRYDEHGQPVGHAGPVLPKPGSQVPTESERSSMGYLSRMQAAAPKLEALETMANRGTRVLPTFFTAGASRVPGGDMARPLLETKEQQQYRQYAEDWIRAKLRKESGASIPPQEMYEEYRTYFPLPGEDPSLRAQKRQARMEAEKQFTYSAGRAMPGGGGGGGAAPADADPLGLRGR